MGARTWWTLALSLTLLACESGGSSGDPNSHPGLRDPEKATEKAPEKFRAKLQTTKGAVVLEVTRAWAPKGADRFYNLVQIGFFTDVAFFRTVEGFMVQFGISGDPKVSAAWARASIKDDPVSESNQRGMLTFAKTGAPNSRATQMFINYKDNGNLDGMGFAPFGKVVEGMDVLDSLHKGYGEKPTKLQGQIEKKGNGFLRKTFPKLDYILSAEIVP